MAVAMERFSIREYAAQMRIADLGKCWPFDGDGRESSLPPIPVRRYRWWSDELEAAQSGRAACEKPDGAAGNESVVGIPSVDPPVDGCVVQEPGEEEARQTRAAGKAKQRAPKKRSMKELFAVAPPVESIDGEADGVDEAGDLGDEAADGEQHERHGEVEEDCSGASDGGGKEAPEASEAPAKRKEAIRKKNPVIEKIKKKNKKKKVEVFAEIKEKVCKPKVPSSINISHILQDLVHKRWFGKAYGNPVDSQQKKPTATKGLKKKHKGKILQTSNLMPRKREVEKLLPIHGILKNQTSASVKKASALVKSHRGNFTKHCRESAKHVSFSGKDAILGHNNICSSMELSQLQSLCKIFSDVLAASSAIDNSSKDEVPAAAESAEVVSVCGKDVATSVVERSNGSFSQKKQLSDSHGHAIPSNTSCADVQKTPTAEILDLNVMQSNIDLNCLNSGCSTLPPNLKHSGDPKVLNFVNNDGLASDAGIHMAENFPRASDTRSLLAPTAKCVSGSDSVSSLTINSTPRSQHPSSCLVTCMEANGRQPQPSLDPDRDFFRPIPEPQPKRHLFPQDLMGSICSSVGSKRSRESSLTSGPGSTCKDKCLYEGFIGLPLNSQGELIKLHPCPEFGFSELYKKQSTILGPNHGFSVPNYVEPNNSVDHGKMKEKCSGTALYHSDQPNWFPEQSCHASKLVTSGLGFSELQGFERMNTPSHVSVKDKNRFARCDENSMKFSCNGCRENHSSYAGIDRMGFQAEGNLNPEFPPSTQPTLRLMGKNVTVGRNCKECQGFDDGRTWTDKKIITEHCSPLIVCDKPLPKRWPQDLVAPPASGSSKENPLRLLEAQSSFYHMPPILPRSDHMQLDCRQRWMLRNGSATTIGKHGNKVDPFRHPLATETVMNEASKSIFSSVSGTETVGMRHHIPVVASHPQNVCQHMLLSSTHCKHTQSVSYSTSSTFHPPFPDHDHVSSSQPLLAPSSPCLPQWLLNAEQQKRNQHCLPSYPNSVAAHHPCVMPGTNLFPLPSPYPTSMIPFPVQMCGSPAPASVLHPSFVTAYMSNKPTCAVTNTCRNKNINRNGTKSKLTCPRGLDHADRSRKRPAAKVDEPMKPVKKASLKMQEDPNTPTCPRRGEQEYGYPQDKIATPESDVYGNRTSAADIPVVGNKKDKLRSPFESCSSKFGGGSGPGPLKLSAGAKHILKPCLAMDQNCPRPIHSTIPISTGTRTGKLPISQKKATKVYRF